MGFELLAPAANTIANSSVPTQVVLLIFAKSSDRPTKGFPSVPSHHVLRMSIQ